MPNETTKTGDEAAIRGLIEDYAKAVRTKDARAAVANYADDVVSFDLAPPLQHRGVENIRKQLEGWFATFRGPIGVELRDLQVDASGDVAVARSFNRISGARTSGEDTDLWVRATICFHRRGGAWKVTHEHISLPFYMDGRMRAADDLVP